MGIQRLKFDFNKPGMWIPISEKLPSKDVQFVLVTTRDGYLSFGQVYFDGEECKIITEMEWYGVYTTEDDEPIAWTYLPLPYEQ